MKSCIISALWKQYGGVCGRKTKNEMLCQTSHVLQNGGTFRMRKSRMKRNTEKTGKAACGKLWTSLWILWITICKKKLSEILCKAISCCGGGRIPFASGRWKKQREGLILSIFGERAAGDRPCGADKEDGRKRIDCAAYDAG